jgi:hypothetical protein
MNASDRLALEFETLASDAMPFHPPHWEPNSTVSTLSEVLRTLSPIPHNALFLGVANDRLPVLLNLEDPVPGPVLITGDPETGKTRLLQVISQFIENGHEPKNIRYTVITDRAAEWERCNQSPNCEGILAFRQAQTANYLNSLVDWAHSSKQDGQFVLMLVDGLEDLVGDGQLQQAFRWLLLRGPSRHIWPIVTLNASHAEAVEKWLAAFRTRLFGHMERQPGDPRTALLTGAAKFSFNNLLARVQFAMRAGKDWLPFWLPSLD